MRTKQKLWTFNKKSREFLGSNELKNNGRMFKGAILSILAGFIVAGIIVAAENVNPFEYYAKLFQLAFHPLYIDQTLQWFSVYIIAGLAMAVGFKTGLFNIGVSGQMLAGASMGTVIFNLLTPNATQVDGWMVLLIFVTCVVMGTLLAGLAGWLKAMFNIHEVVSTIMLNWTVWYLFKFVFLRWSHLFISSGSLTKTFPEGALNWGHSEIVLPIIIALLTVFIVWFIFSKTVFGFRLKAVGSSTSVSKYAGINVKNKIIVSMAISGALAGMASFVNIFTVSPNLSFGLDNLPTVGYDAIAVALVAFNNPFGVIGASALWGIVQSAGGSAAALFNMPSQLSLLIFGVIVYFAAISIIFIKWAPNYSIKLRYYIWNSKLYSNKTKELNRKVLQYRWWLYEPNRNEDYSKQMSNFKQRIKVAQSSVEVKEIKTEMRNYKFNFKENCRLNLSKYDTQLKNFKTNIYLKEIERGLRGIKTRSRKRINKVNEHGLEQINLLNLELVKTKTHLSEMMDQVVNVQKHKVKALKNQFIKDKNALKVLKEADLGELKLDFELQNSSIAFKGEYSKQKNALQEEIKNARSNQRMQLHLLKFNDQLEHSVKSIERKQINEATHVKIEQIKLEIKELKKVLDQNLLELKTKHAQRANDLRTNPTKIQKIESKYADLLVNLKEKYAQDLAEIEAMEFDRVKRFNLPKAHAELKQGQVILNQGLIRINNLNENSTDDKKQIRNLTAQLTLINDITNELNSLFGRNKFKIYDDDETVGEKVKMFMQLAKLEHLYGVQLAMMHTNQNLVKTQSQNKIILNNYKKNLNNFKAEYKNNLQALKQQPKDEKYHQSVIENEQVYVNKINDYIGDLEKKYLINKVVMN